MTERRAEYKVNPDDHVQVDWHKYVEMPCPVCGCEVLKCEYITIIDAASDYVGNALRQKCVSPPCGWTRTATLSGLPNSGPGIRWS